MWTQALNTDTFADIGYLPNSWCGNSDHTLFLAPGEQWSFVMPKYEGRRSTRPRPVLRYNTGAQPRPEQSLKVYSATFPDGVNKGWFERKQGHRPQGIMDPYDESMAFRNARPVMNRPYGGEVL